MRFLKTKPFFVYAITCDNVCITFILLPFSEYQGKHKIDQWH